MAEDGVDMPTMCGRKFLTIIFTWTPKGHSNEHIETVRCLSWKVKNHSYGNELSFVDHNGKYEISYIIDTLKVGS